MKKYLQCKFPEITPEFNEILSQGKPRVVIGILGRSVDKLCNKLKEFDILLDVSDLDQLEKCGKDGDIQFFCNSSEDTIFIHFNTIYDSNVMEDCIDDISTGKYPSLESFILFNSHSRSTFGRILLFALQICHIIVMVEPGPCFDASYLSLFKSIKIIREKYVLKFLPKMLKNVPSMRFLESEGRICSPRVLFLFESSLQDYENDLDWLKIEEAMEEHIYQLLRNEFIITNNSSMSLFSIPRKRRFVYYAKDHPGKFSDPVETTLDLFMSMLDGTWNPEMIQDEIRPYKGFAKSWNCDNKTETYSDTKKKRFRSLIQEHVKEALTHGFDDNLSKYRGKGNFSLPNLKQWLEGFKLLHKIFIQNPIDVNFEANDSDYAAFIENFHGIIDIDERFFEDSCQKGLEFGLSTYKEGLAPYYGFDIHEKRKSDALEAFANYARGPLFDSYYEKLKDTCESIWFNGKQACEILSLRGNPCIMAKHEPKDPDEHSSGVVYISACNCGKIQGNRADPYTVKQANYDFYQTLALSCPNCLKVEKFRFPVFEPSVNDFKAAAAAAGLKLKSLGEFHESQGVTPELADAVTSMHLSGSQKTQSQDDLSLPESLGSNISNKSEVQEEDDEIVIKIGEKAPESNIERQISTTEYLASMVQINSPMGVLPQYPSFSLVCIGPSSIYSHNTGLPESTQSGFLSNSNYLLPWERKIRLEHQQSWAERYERTRLRRKHGGNTATNDGQNFNLKIFVGCEYECQRGHRFFLSSPTTILKGSQGIVRDSGSKIVTNDMPLYFPCPCRSQKPFVSQLMRVHIVTPKAPVNVIIEPKIKLNVSGTTKMNNLIFTTGIPDPIKLSQSTYWVLRLPYIYESENGPIMPPMECSSENAISYGCLLAGMYGVKESDVMEGFE
uniref:Nonsense-mediated mRNA decay factor SMG8 n=1 Tax=Culicoides sonorensis TaxID=179676 RepID=A0A336LT62_CULSO